MNVDAPARPPPDAGQIAPAEWPFRPIGELVDGQRQPGFQVVVSESALAAMREHGQSTTASEVGGVMVGNVHHDHLGPYLLIHAVIPADRTRADAAHVTFTADTWAHIHDRMDRRFPDDRIVGWYHTHPDFGVFLSEMDIFIQANFFDLPWQVAFVYDPVRHEQGMFVWRGGEPRREPIMVEKLNPTTAGAAILMPGSANQPGTWFWVVFLVLVAMMLSAVTVFEWSGLTLMGLK